MTQAYARLQEKLKSTGRAYLDGFAAQDFYGLTDLERKEVTNELRARVEQGDGVALDGLRQALSAEEYDAFTNAELATHQSLDPVAAHLAIDAFNKHPCGDTFNRVLHVLRAGDTSVRRIAVNGLAMHDLSQDQRVALAPVLTELAKNETEPGLLIVAVSKLLQSKGMAPGSEEFVRWVGLLRGGDRRSRFKALHDLLGKDSEQV